jgi:hypothetical protein
MLNNVIGINNVKKICTATAIYVFARFDHQMLVKCAKRKEYNTQGYSDNVTQNDTSSINYLQDVGRDLATGRDFPIFIYRTVCLVT